MASLSDSVKRLLFGRKLRSDRIESTRLPKRIALPVFASDALSSNAYATQEILLVLSLGGMALYAYAPWVAAAVVVVFTVVVLSYRQNVHAYPSGGGDYEVVHTNLGPRWGVFVASALLVDYVLTVSVSISAAVDNLASAITAIQGHQVAVAVALTVGLMLMNLRGVRESGIAFAIPTYAFMAAMVLLLGWAAVRMLRGDVMRAESADWTLVAEGSFTGLALAFLIARAFSSGTTALTGVEAISNGVPAFREPKSRNAATTLALLGLISMTLFAGITWLAVTTGVQVAEFDRDLIGLPAGQEQKTVIAQIANAVFDSAPLLAALVTVATALVLVLAANTAFNGFPLLGSVLARDGYLPRQLHNRGDRLAFSNGILMLAGLAMLLIVAFDASVTRLIQLYIIGVFVSFTLSQFSMIRHWTRLLRTERDSLIRRRAQRSRIINAVGFVLTSSVLLIITSTKFIHGAWIVLVAMPLIYLLMTSIRGHYDRVAAELALADGESAVLPSRVHAVVLVSKLHRPALRALAYARATRPTTLEAVTVAVDVEATQALLRDWDHRNVPVTLRVLDSPFRDVTRPLLEHIASLRRRSPRDLVAVYIPEYVVGHWWEQLLHNQSALRVKTRLRFAPGVTVVSVPWQLDSSVRAANRADTPNVRRVQ